MLVSNSAVADIAGLTPFGMVVAQVWRSFQNSANVDHQYGAVLGDLREFLARIGRCVSTGTEVMLVEMS